MRTTKSVHRGGSRKCEIKGVPRDLAHVEALDAKAVSSLDAGRSDLAANIHALTKRATKERIM